MKMTSNIIDLLASGRDELKEADLGPDECSALVICKLEFWHRRIFLLDQLIVR